MQEQTGEAQPAEEASRSSRSVLMVLVATALSAVSSFLVLLIVAPALGPAGYAVFAVYWAALFMVVGVLFGVQQETTRAVAFLGSTPGPSEATTSPMRAAPSSIEYSVCWCRWTKLSGTSRSLCRSPGRSPPPAVRAGAGRRGPQTTVV